MLSTALRRTMHNPTLPRAVRAIAQFQIGQQSIRRICSSTAVPRAVPQIPPSMRSPYLSPSMRSPYLYGAFLCGALTVGVIWWECAEGGEPVNLNDDGTLDPTFGADAAAKGKLGEMKRWGAHSMTNHTYHGHMNICGPSDDLNNLVTEWLALKDEDLGRLGVALTAAFAASFPGGAAPKIYRVDDRTTRMFVAAGQDPIESTYSVRKYDNTLYVTIKNDTLEGHALTGCVSLTYRISREGISASVVGIGDGCVNAGRATWLAGMGKYLGTWTVLFGNDYRVASENFGEVGIIKAYKIGKENHNLDAEGIRAKMVPSSDSNSIINWMVYGRVQCGLPVRFPQYRMAGLGWSDHNIFKHKRKTTSIQLKYTKI